MSDTGDADRSAGDQLVVRVTAKTTFEMGGLVGILKGAGVPVYANTGLLSDEFASAQALMNMGTEIRVRSADRQRAEAALRVADEASALLDSEDFDPGEADAADGPDGGPRPGD